jgi:hypothetical protein
MKARHFFGVWLVLTAAGSAQSVVSETEYFAVFMEGKKVGYAIHTRQATKKKVTTTDTINMTMSRVGVPVTMIVTETSIETIDGKPLGFEAVQDYSMMTMKVAGSVNEQGTVDVTVTSMGAERKSTLEWPSGAVMAEGLRLLTLKKGLKEGLSYATKIFSPSIVQALDARMRIGPKRNVDLLGRVVALTEVTTTMTMPMAGEIVTTSYVDKELSMQKTIMPMIEGICAGRERCAGTD